MMRNMQNKGVEESILNSQSSPWFTSMNNYEVREIIIFVTQDELSQILIFIHTDGFINVQFQVCESEKEN